MDYETYERYGPKGFQAELDEFDRYARQMIKIQERNSRKSGRTVAARGFQAKSALGVQNATLCVREDLPEELRQDCFQPRAQLPAIVRLSNASGMHQPDGKKDMRGIAVRLTAPNGEHVHDLLMTNFERPPAANAAEFMAVARALAGLSSAGARLVSLLLRLPVQVGLSATIRIIANLLASGRTVQSLATQTYWSRGAIMWGDAGPVRYLLRPVGADQSRPARTRPDSVRGDEALRLELQHRLGSGPIQFELAVQRFDSEATTPVEDVSKPWRVEPVVCGQLVIPEQDLDTAEARLTERHVDQLAFNPWNTTEAFRPLGNLNRARRAIYEASAAHRMGQRFEAEVGPVQAAVDVAAGGAFGLLGHRVAWHRLPTRLSLLNLAVLRRQLRRENLIDSNPRPRRVEVRQPTPAPTAAERLQRDASGQYNDLSSPQMGATGSPFGRNMRVDRNQSDLPHLKDVSELLLARDHFIPASSLNMLAAAWIQFQVHDWANHRRFDVWQRSIDVQGLEGVMRIAAEDGPGNQVSHWWDGSEVYGTPANPESPNDRGKRGSFALRVGDSADLALDEHECLPLETDGLPRTDFGDAWWLGLSVLQTLMTREHNAVCTALREEYPLLSEDRIFQIARLVVSALIAKIHTVEWTPAILGTKAIDLGMNVLWSGAPADRLSALGIRLLDPGQLRGTAGSFPDHHGVPFALTEEFVTVYRMHQLIPDDFTFLHRAAGRWDSISLPGILGKEGEQVLRKYGLSDILYSFAIANPGAVTLHNFPKHLRKFSPNGANPIDLAAVDILRTRQRGVPRYNDFRAQLHMPRFRRFEQLTTDPYSLARLKRVYGSVDEIDTVVGLLAEKPPAGFGFSDTAFRLFLLMASRRLQSDRFLTVDFRPEVYTPLGMDWIERNSFSSLLLRHCPQLAGVVSGGKAVFAPWPRAEAALECQSAVRHQHGRAPGTSRRACACDRFGGSRLAWPGPCRQPTR